MNKKRLLVIGDPLTQVTGLSYVAGWFTKLFIESGKYDVAYLEHNSIPQNNNYCAIDEYSSIFNNIPVFKTVNDIPIKEFNQCFHKFKPQIVFTVLDPWQLELLALTDYRPSYYWVAYCTAEVPKYADKIYNMSPITKQPYKSIKLALQGANLVIPVTQMGKNTYRNMGLTNVTEENVFNGLEIEKKCTLPIDKLKKELFGSNCNEDTFLFMTMGVNAERKKIERTIMAFSEFMKLIPENEKEKYKLYIHSNVFRTYSGPDLGEVIADSGVAYNIIALGNDRYIPKSEFYKFYQASDCIIGLPGGEGMAYIFMEGMLHKKPIIFSDYGGHTEYANQVGLPVKIHDYVYGMRVGWKWGLADVKDAAQQMLKVVKDEKLRKELGEKGYKYAIENFDWKVVFPKLQEIIEENYNKSDFKNLYGKDFRRII